MTSWAPGEAGEASARAPARGGAPGGGGPGPGAGAGGAAGDEGGREHRGERGGDDSRGSHGEVDNTVFPAGKAMPINANVHFVGRCPKGLAAPRPAWSGRTWQAAVRARKTFKDHVGPVE